MQFPIKTIGVCCIMAASILLGRQADHAMKKRCTLLSEIYELFLFLEKEMSFHRATIQEAFRSAAATCVTELAAVLTSSAGEIDKREGRPFREIWKDAVDAHLPDTLLSENARMSLLESADALCNPDTVMQRTLLQKYCERFDAMRRQEQESCREKGALIRRLSAAAGAFLAILLL